MSARVEAPAVPSPPRGPAPRQRCDPQTERRYPPAHPQARVAQLLVPRAQRTVGRLAQARQSAVARRGALPFSRNHRRRGGHPGRLPASRRAPERGQLPLSRHGGVPLPRLGVRRVRQERGRAFRRPNLRRVRKAGDRSQDVPHPYPEGGRVRLDRRGRSRPHRGGRARGVLPRGRARPYRPGLLAVQLGGRPRELDGLARQLRASRCAGGGPGRLHRARRAGRASDLRGQRVRGRRGRE